MKEFVKDRFEFSYESDIMASRLAVSVDAGEKIRNYQIEMITNNRINRILHFDVKLKNDRVSFCYNVTSKLPLSQFLKRRKLERDDFIRILSGVARALMDCRNYLLDDKCFVIEEDYIYINPSTLDVSLVYIPVFSDIDINRRLRDFVAGLIMKSADIDGNGGDNFLHRVLSHVKSETFNVSGFAGLLKELMDSRNVLTAACEGAPSQNGNAPLSKESVKGSDKAGLYIESRLKYRRVVVILACQMGILTIAALSINFIRLAGEGKVLNLLAAALIIGAPEVFVLRKLLMKKRPGINGKSDSGQDDKTNVGHKGRSGAEERARPVSGKRETDMSDKPRKEGHPCDISLSTQEKLSPYSGTGMNETVFLGFPGEKNPYFVGNRNGVSELIPVTKPDFAVGRLEGQVDHVLHSKAVGKVHAHIISKDGNFFIVDLNSKNGTFINDERLDSNREYRVKNNDRVTFANSEFVFIIPHFSMRG